MDDGASTIFLNAEGTMDDISVELKLFLDYVAGKKAEDPYIDKLDEAVKKAEPEMEAGIYDFIHARFGKY